MNRYFFNNIVFNITLVVAATFIILKLANVIDWPWLIVLFPFWGVILLYLFIYIICRVGLLITLWLIQRRKRSVYAVHVWKRGMLSMADIVVGLGGT